MRVLVVGGGGREHALVWKLSRSALVKELFAAPGNAGIASLATCLDMKADDITALAKFAVNERLDLVVVGPEVPLCMGIADLLHEAGVPVFGPSSKAAMIEGSKVFSKKFMKKYGIPTARYESFDDFAAAVGYAKSLDSDMWIKASGLAAGKGAVYASDPGEAERILRRMMIEDDFGDAGRQVVVEENMKGEEASIFALCDGETYRLLVPSQDHKRIYDGDEGPNTGGMGAYAPAPVVTDEIMAKVEREILRPTMEGMAKEGAPYVGCLYAGLMIDGGNPRVVEFNCRFGDPETQAVLPLLDGDLGEIMAAAVNGDLGKVSFETSDGFALCVVIASGGYPGAYEKGRVVHGLDEARSVEGTEVFHAGTKRVGDDIVTSGGRVLGVTGWGADFHEARDRAYRAVECIRFEDAYYRRDIGHRALKYIEG